MKCLHLSFKLKGELAREDLTGESRTGSSGRLLLSSHCRPVSLLASRWHTGTKASHLRLDRLLWCFGTCSFGFVENLAFPFPGMSVHCTNRMACNYNCLEIAELCVVWAILWPVGFFPQTTAFLSSFVYSSTKLPVTAAVQKEPLIIRNWLIFKSSCYFRKWYSDVCELLEHGGYVHTIRDWLLGLQTDVNLKLSCSCNNLQEQCIYKLSV